MLKLFLAVFLGSTLATMAHAEGVVEIRHKSLRPGGHVVYYWCLEKNELPAEYFEGFNTVMGTPVDMDSGQLLIASQPDYGVFVTSESCLEESVAGYVYYGGVAEDLTITKK